jgi:hypothetical protein
LEQVYLWRKELRPRIDAIVERQLRAPSGYDVGLRVDLIGESPKSAVALAYGAAVRRCYAAIFETTVVGNDDAELGGRLRLVVDGVLDRIEIMGVEGRALGN